MKKEMINKILRVVWTILISGTVYNGPTLVSKISYISIPEINFSSPARWGIGIGVLIALLLPLLSGTVREQLKHKFISTLPIAAVGMLIFLCYLLSRFGFRIKVDEEFLLYYHIFVSVGIIINAGLTLKKLFLDDLQPDSWDLSWFRKKEAKKSNGRRAAAEEARRAAAEEAERKATGKEAERKEVVIKADYF